MLAQLTFIRPMAVQPSLDITGASPGNLKLEQHQVELADADGNSVPPTLASHGFGAVPFSASLPDGEIDAAYRAHFANLCALAVQKEIGAPQVIGVPLAVQVRRSNGIAEEAPISVSHTDFTPAT